MSKNKFETDLQARIAGLDKHKLPQRDLWQGIELGLSDESNGKSASTDVKRPRRGGLYAIAASLAFVGMLSWFAVQQTTPQFDGQELIAALSNQHEAQKNALLVKFADQPALTDNWQQQIKELDAAAIAIKSALQQDPNNVALLKMLQNVYQQQIDLIERVHSPKFRSI